MPESARQVFQRREPECPPVLLLQYNRFLFDRVSNTAVKMDNKIMALESLTFGGGEYELWGFLVRSGNSCYSGHYTAVVRCARSGDYFIANNYDPIEPIDKKEALDFALHVYILLYEKHMVSQHGLLDVLLGDALTQLQRAERQVKY